MSRIFFSRLTDWLLYTSLFAACCAVSLCYATEALAGGSIPVLFTPLHLFIAGSTLIVYNLHFLTRKAAPGISDRSDWSIRHRMDHYLIVFTGLLLCLAGLRALSPAILLLSFLAGAVSLAYTLPVLPGGKSLRTHGWVKIMALTLVWTIVTSVLPLLYHGLHPFDFPLEILIRFLFIFPLCIAFDIRDMPADTNQGITTLPGKLGIRKSVRLIYLLIALFLCGCLGQHLRFPDTARLVGSMAIGLLTIPVIRYCIRYPSDKNLLGMTDGMMLLYGIVIVLLHA